jgi:capsular polysaccharide biosynthesis protein
MGSERRSAARRAAHCYGEPVSQANRGLDRTSDDWYESEASTRRGMIAEIQRVRRRFRARPLPVLAVAAALTALITWRLSLRKHVYEAEVVLALSQGAMSTKHNGLPVDELREYVDGVLLPDAKLRELIERRDLYRLRKTLGPEYAIEELRSQLSVQVWKNSFVYYDEDAANAEHSARIGITLADNDPDRAYTLAHDVAQIVIDTAREHDQQRNAELASEIAALHDGLAARLDALVRTIALDHEALDAATKRRQPGVAETLTLQIAELERERKSADKRLHDIAISRDALADRIAAAGLDTRVAVVEEHRPDRPEHPGFVLALAAAVIGFASLLASAFVVGAFDSRIHDLEDVERLGLTKLGHVPGFAGDDIGSLARRDIPLARVTSRRTRWRRRS